MGVTAAAPMVSTNKALKLSTMLLLGMSSSAPPSSSRPTPSAPASGTIRRMRSSYDERRSTVRGGVKVASIAGTAAATSVVSRPSKKPFSSGPVLISTLRIETVKYRSLIVCVTSWIRPRPSAMPSSTPATAPTTPTTSASPSTSAKICRRETPMQRRVPSKPRRCTTEKVMVL